MNLFLMTPIFKNSDPKIRGAARQTLLLVFLLVKNHELFQGKTKCKKCSKNSNEKSEISKVEEGADGSIRFVTFDILTDFVCVVV